MRCEKCGKTVRKQQTVCPWCGEKREEKPAEPKMVRLDAKGATKRRRLTPKQKKWLIGIGTAVGVVLLALIVTAVSLIGSMLGRINRESELSHGEIDVNEGLPHGDDVQNIALFGLDTRANSESGRSDAIIILTIDRVHDKIKLTSIARDSLVKVEGHGDDKITHAFAYGKAKLAVKTLNQNFGMNITDYAYINFFEFAEIIDLIGGVMIDVDERERAFMNGEYSQEMRDMGFNYKKVQTTGLQRLDGPQALLYSRTRKIDSDINRSNRQKEVLEAMFAQVKDVPLSKYPALISSVLEKCHTSLSNSEMLRIARWALAKSPTFESFSMPSPECKAIGGIYLHHGWVYRFDLEYATLVLHSFIYEEAMEENRVPILLTTTSRNLTSGTTTTTTATTTTSTTSTTSGTGSSASGTGSSVSGTGSSASGTGSGSSASSSSSSSSSSSTGSTSSSVVQE